MAIGDLRWKSIKFGDDYWGTVVDEKPPYINPVGKEVKGYLVVPTQDLIEAYPEILKKPGIMNISTPLGRALWVEYPTIWVCDENMSRKNAIAHIDCGFDGRETPHTKRYKAKDEEITQLQKQNEIYKNRVYMLNEELKDALEDIRGLMEKNAEIDKIVKRSRHEPDTEQGPLPYLPPGPG